MTKELQKMKIDKRNDSCSNCDYVFKQENIVNIGNVDLYEDIDFSEEIDEDSVFNELDGETEHISAIFDAMHDKQAQKNTVKVEIIEDKSENIILSDNKPDEQRPNLNSVNIPVHNSANNSVNRVTASTRKITRKSRNLVLDPPSSADDKSLCYQHSCCYYYYYCSYFTKLIKLKHP